MKKLLLTTSICLCSLFSFKVKAQTAFFYQTVGPFVSGVGLNTVEIGITFDGINITTNQVSALDFYVGASVDSTYGDPVFSYLSNGNWTFTAWTGASDPRGAGKILYYEAPCPVVVDNDVIALGADTTIGCQMLPKIIIGKSSQLFETGGKTYVLHSIPQLGVHVSCLSDGINLAMDLTDICVKPIAYPALSDLNYGESMPIFDTDSLRLSDVAIAKRNDGTWVLFMKGVSDTSTCAAGSICELSARGIYRTTTTDFINFTPLEKVVSKASVPEASTSADGTVWLYWQDFTATVAANDLAVSNRAPISGASETPGTYVLSAPIQASFPDEPFQTNTTMHYATNGNPIHLPDAAAISDLQSCVIANGGTWTGIDNINSANSMFHIFPNPATDHINLKLPENETGIIYIVNYLGEIIFSKQISGVETLNCDNWSNGIYFFHFYDENKNYISGKFIKTEKP